MGRLLRSVLTHSILLRPAGRPPTGGAVGNSVLREDGSYVLREDGGQVLRE
jgi:hypothetical protein